MKATILFAIAITAMLSGSHAATADSAHRRYRIVPFPVAQNGAAEKIVILDQSTGTLLTWSAAEGASYLPGFLKLGNPAGFARIIDVSR
jgi:hypothetical protein